jgi:hypothetical protein
VPVRATASGLQEAWVQASVGGRDLSSKVWRCGNKKHGCERRLEQEAKFQRCCFKLQKSVMAPGTVVVVGDENSNIILHTIDHTYIIHISLEFQNKIKVYHVDRWSGSLDTHNKFHSHTRIV